MLQPTAAPRMEAPAASILTVARRLPAGTEWRSGISFLPNGCSPAYSYPTCEVVGPITELNPWPEKETFEDVSRSDFNPWTMYVPDGCLQRPYYSEDYGARAKEALMAYSAGALSAELELGTNSGNPSLVTACTDISPASPIDLRAGIARLLQERVANGFTTDHVIHMPLWLLPTAEFMNLVVRSGALLSTAGGNALVSPGPGYTGVGPTGADPLTDGEAYIYVTGPVEYEMTDPFLNLDEDEQQGRVNQAETWAERFAIYRFAECGNYAVRVSDSCCAPLSEVGGIA